MEHRFENLPLILATGQARSGTTVLTHAIGAHPEIRSNLKESSIINDIAASLRTNLENLSRKKELSVSPDQLALHFRRFLLHSLFPSEAFEQNQPPPKAISTFSSMRYENFDFLAKIFPRLVIANIYRNGIEVVASRLTHSNIGQRFDFENHCTAWAHARDAMEWGSGKTAFVKVPHHDLADREKAESVFSNILTQVGLHDPKPCADFVLNNVINTNNSPAVKDASDNAGLSDRVERWRDWTDQQREKFEDLCGDSMEFFGFPIPWKQSISKLH